MTLPPHFDNLQGYFGKARQDLQGLGPNRNRSQESIREALRIFNKLEKSEDETVLDTLGEWQGKGVKLADIVFYVAVANLGKKGIEVQREKRESIGASKRRARKKAMIAEEKWKKKNLSLELAVKAGLRLFRYDDRSITQRLALQTGTPPSKKGTFSRPFYDMPTIRLCSSLHRIFKRFTKMSDNEILEVISQALAMFKFTKSTLDNVDVNSLKKQLRRWRTNPRLRPLFYHLD